MAFPPELTIGLSARVMRLLQSVNRRRQALHARLDLKREYERIVARQVKVATVEPEARLLGRLPHVSWLALPWARIAWNAGAEPPALADLVRNVLGNDGRHRAVHRLESGRHNDE